MNAATCNLANAVKCGSAECMPWKMGMDGSGMHADVPAACALCYTPGAQGSDHQVAPMKHAGAQVYDMVMCVRARATFCVHASAAMVHRHTLYTPHRNV